MQQTPRPHPPMRVDAATHRPTQQASAVARSEHIRPVVIDANVLVEEVVYRLPQVRDGVTIRPGRSTALADALAAGAVRLYGKVDVIDEVMRHLDTVTVLKPREAGAASALLETDYISRMRLADASTVEIDDPNLREVAKRHSPDEPTARLACLLAPAYVLTRDKDLLDNHFGQWFEEGGLPASWSAIAYTINDRSFDSKLQAGTASAVTAVSATGAGVAWAWRAHPRITSTALVVAAVTAYLTRRSPRWASLGHAVRPLVEHVAEELLLHNSDAQRAKAQLDEYERAHPGPKSPEAILARYLALAGSEGLSAAELYDICAHRFAVRPILEVHPVFTRDDSGRWHLGHPARMPG